MAACLTEVANSECTMNPREKLRKRHVPREHTAFTKVLPAKLPKSGNGEHVTAALAAPGQYVQ